MTAPTNPPVNLIVRPPTVPRPAAEKPTVKVRPVLTAATNAASIAAATVVYTGAGPAMLIAAGAAGVAGAAVVAGQKARATRAARSSSGWASSGGMGRRSGGSLGRVLGGGRSAAGRSGGLGSAAARRRSGSAASGGTAGKGATRRGMLSRIGSSLGRALPASMRTRAGAKPSQARKSGAGAKASPIRNAMRKVGGGLAWPFRVTRKTGAGSPARNPGGAKGTGGAKAGNAVGSPTRSRTRRAMRKVGAVVAWPFRRKTKAVVHGPDAKKQDAKPAVRKPGDRTPVTGKLRTPDGADPATAGNPEPVDPGQPVRRQHPATDREVVSAARSGGTGMASGVQRLIEGAEDLQQIARRYDPPEGVMEFIDRELVLYGELMRALAKVHQIFHDRAMEEVPLHPAVLGAIEALAPAQLKIAEAADAISGYARKIEEKRIEELQDPRNARWDHRANPGHAAR